MMKPHHKQRGIAAIELGILMLILVPLLFGITEFGRAIYQYNALTKSTRDAARFLSSQGPGDANDLTTARNLVVYGRTASSDAPIVPNLTAAMVSVCDSSSCPGSHQNIPTGSGVINLVTVTVNNYPFTSMVPVVVPDLTFGPISTTMRQ
jgi:Flp pilus assembly protein TadG